jgi:hypothetical protein
MLHASDAPLFRVLARRWHPVDRRERRMTPFQFALSAGETPPPGRNSFGPNKRAASVANRTQKSAGKWNPWMMMK